MMIAKEPCPLAERQPAKRVAVSNGMGGKNRLTAAKTKSRLNRAIGLSIIAVTCVRMVLKISGTSKITILS